MWDAITGGEDARVELIESILNFLLVPVQPNLVIQSYFDQLSIFVTFAAGLFVIELLYRSVICMKADTSPALEARQLLYSGMFLFGVVVMLPGALGSTQFAFSVFGRWVATTFVNVDEAQPIIDTLTQMSDIPALNGLLSFIQILILLIFGISLVLVPACLYISSFALVLGVSLRWLSTVGETLFKLSIFITVYALVGPGLYLVVIGIGTVIVRMESEDETWERALMNTGVFMLAALVTIITLHMFKAKIKAAVDGAVKTAQSGAQKLKSGYRRIRGKGKEQVEKTAKTKRRHTEKMGGDASDDPSVAGNTRRSRLARAGDLLKTSARVGVKAGGGNVSGALRTAHKEARKLKQRNRSSTSQRSKSSLLSASGIRKAKGMAEGNRPARSAHKPIQRQGRLAALANNRKSSSAQPTPQHKKQTAAGTPRVIIPRSNDKAPAPSQQSKGRTQPSRRRRPILPQDRRK